ncbi:MAG: hypothetical protein K0R17_3052 [Rariglobus sp.]|jgi:hypothetical protein|nr:hypothetical protein [Rariglobus sp.]
MKALITAAGLFACLSSAGFAAPGIVGLTGKVTISMKATFEDESKDKESKSYEAHELAIENDQSSVFKASWATTSVKVGNREILEAMFDNIKGWSLMFVEGSGFEGVVAYKKGQTAVPVPEEYLTFDPSENDGVSRGGYTESYSAPADAYNEFLTEHYTNLVSGVALFGVSLSGIDRGTLKEHFTETPTKETFSFSVGGTMSLTGAGDASFDDDDLYVLLEGKASYSIKSVSDVSAYLPAP